VENNEQTPTQQFVNANGRRSLRRRPISCAGPLIMDRSSPRRWAMLPSLRNSSDAWTSSWNSSGRHS